VAGLLGADELATVRLEGNSAIILPGELKWSLIWAADFTSLDPATRLDAEVLVLQCPEVPLGRVSLELKLESFVVAYLRLVCCHVHPYAAGHKLLVGDRLKAGLGKGVLQANCSDFVTVSDPVARLSDLVLRTP